MGKKLKCGVLSGMFVLSCAISGYVFFVPTSINVKAESNRIYEMTDVTKDDISVYSRTLFGSESKIADYDVKNEDDDKTIIVTAGHMSKKCVLNKIPVEYITAEYKDTVFPGDKLSADKFLVKAVYKDNTTKKLSTSEYTLSDLPNVMEDKVVSVKVKSDGGNATVKIRPVKVSGLKVSYDGDLKVGDIFDISKVKMIVTFEDGSSKTADDISSDFEGTVAMDSVIIIKSKRYGEQKLSIDTSNISKLDIGYAKNVYEGDELTPDILKITATMADNTTSEVKGLSFDSVHVFYGDVVEAKSESLGTLKCTIKPVKVTDFTVDASVKNDDTLHVRGLTAVYEDGTTKKLNMSDVEFVTDMSQKLTTGKNQIKFKWFGHEFSTVVTYEG